MREAGRSPASTLWLQLLLVGALVSVATLALLLVRQRYATQDVGGRLLRDYGAVAAWSYREHLVAELRAAADELLGGVNHGEGMHESPEVPPVEWAGHSMRWDPKCGCHKPRRGPVPLRAFAFVLGSDTGGVATNYSPRVGWLGDPIPDVPRVEPPPKLTGAERRETNRILSAATRRTPRTSWGYLVTVARRGGDPSRILLSRPMPTSWGDTLVYAIEYGTLAMEELFGGVLAGGALLPPTLLGGRANEDLLAIHVSLEDTLPIYSRGRMQGDSPVELAQLDSTFGGLTIAAQIRPELGGELFLGEAPSSRVPVLSVMLLLALALTVVAAVQLRREVRFGVERERFVANVSHELRTPLAQVRLVLDTIRLGRERDATMRRSALDLADREVLRLQHLVDGLLRFTRGPRGDAMPLVEIDIAAEARRVASEFQPLATPHQVRVMVQGAESVMARMQPGALRQVLLNLLDNAVKYGKDGSAVTVEVSVPEGRGPRLSVSDEGPGVPPAERERIFESFERGGRAQERAAGGSGIGLTIVREIATAHGGSISVESSPSGGARFVLQLPAERT